MVLGSLDLNAPILSASKLYYRIRNLDHSVRIVTEDWDTLVILDACRFDTFETVCDFDGTLERRRSLGSATDEFVEQNFGQVDTTTSSTFQPTPASKSRSMGRFTM